MTKKNIRKSILHCIENLNSQTLDLILDSEITYLNYDKKHFIILISDCFDQFRNNGDSSLKTSKGKCKFLNDSTQSYFLTGEKSRNYISLNIETIDEKVIGISECYCFSDISTNKNGNHIFIDSKKGSPF